MVGNNAQQEIEALEKAACFLKGFNANRMPRNDDAVHSRPLF
jgi:hypothetical protein